MQNKYVYDRSVFKNLNNPESLYWFGFLMADGCMIEKGIKKTVVLSISQNDHSHMEKFRDFLKTNQEVHRYKNKCSGTSVIAINDADICLDLHGLGLAPRKTLILKFPEYLKKHPLASHFIRGYFDGDGCISLKKHKTKYFLHLNLVGTYDFMQNILDIFYQQLNIHKRKITCVGKVFAINLNRIKDILKIKDFLYRNSTIHLERKFNIFNDFSNDKFGTTSRKKGVCFSHGKGKWRATYYDSHGKRKEKSCLKSEREAIAFLENLPKDFFIDKYEYYDFYKIRYPHCNF